jgi:hypothetical protein
MFIKIFHGKNNKKNKLASIYLTFVVVLKFDNFFLIK